MARETEHITLPVPLGWAWLGTLRSRGVRWDIQECGRLGKKKTQKEGRSHLPALNDNDVDDGEDCDAGGDGVTPVIHRTYSALGACL